MALTIDDAVTLLQAVQRSGAGGGLRAGNWDTVTGTPTSQYLHGPGGLFGTLGLERDVISTRVAPRGLLSRLPAQNTNVIWPEFPYLMGFTNAQDGTDEEFDDAGVCDDGPVAGQIQGCIQTAQFGMYVYETEAIDIGRVGQQINRGEFMDLRLVGDVLGGPSLAVPETSRANQAVLLNNDALTKLVAVGVAYQNKLIRQVYTGNPANNNAGGNYKEFMGLDLLIRTGHQDAHTQQSCPGLDSLIADYEDESPMGDDGGITFVNQVTWMYRMLQYRADATGLAPAKIVLTMRQTTFWEAAAVWACAYWSYRCGTTSSGPNQENVVGSIDVRDSVNFRDDMRRNKYLLIDGEQVEVVIDDGIVETVTSDEDGAHYSSNIYFVPLVVNANLAATVLQFYDYSAAIGAARTFNFTDNEFWTDGGRFLWIRKVPRLRCIQLHSEVQPRLVLRTPHLAGVLKNVLVTPFMHEPSPLFGDAGYEYEGVTVRSGYGPSLFDNDGEPIIP